MDFLECMVWLGDAWCWLYEKMLKYVSTYIREEQLINTRRMNATSTSEEGGRNAETCQQQS